MREVEFHQPVFVGDVVSFYARTLKVGRTSVGVKVCVEAERRTSPGELVTVTEAEVVYVQVGEDNRPQPIAPTSSS
jgi:acyl-CoA thioesterase YciA